MHRLRPIVAIGLMLSVLVTACGGDGSADDSSASLEVTAPSGASTTGFEPTALEVAADTPFTIHFSNEDQGVPHNVQLFEGSDTSGDPVWAPDGDAVITGPDEAEYSVPALSAGTYTFNCLTHPTTMVGTLTVG
jgi:plastocyanin